MLPSLVHRGGTSHIKATVQIQATKRSEPLDVHEGIGVATEMRRKVKDGSHTSCTEA